MKLTADNTAIVLDSTADFPDAAQHHPSWRVVPLYVNFGTDSFRSRRCLVVADGFYEWKKLDSKTKQPHLIRRQDRRPFGFAGLWSWWQDRQAAAAPTIETFTILTTDPNDLLRPLHDRMPVILDRSDFAAWLDPGNRDAAHLRSLLVPSPVTGWEAIPVSRAVNSPDHDEPDCIEPLVAEPPVT